MSNTIFIAGAVLKIKKKKANNEAIITTRKVCKNCKIDMSTPYCPYCGNRQGEVLVVDRKQDQMQGFADFAKNGGIDIGKSVCLNVDSIEAEYEYWIVDADDMPCIFDWIPEGGCYMAEIDEIAKFEADLTHPKMLKAIEIVEGLDFECKASVVVGYFSKKSIKNI